MSRFPEIAAIALLIAGPALADPLGLGRPAEPDEIAAWDTDIRPDGLGLPEGSGDVATGEVLFTDQCAVCHGDFGEGVDRWPVLAGGQDTLTSDRPVKTIGSYWPYLSTVFDYVNRAMPFGAAHTLDADETYAITAYLLYLNDLADDDFVLSRENFGDIRLPNEANFFPDDRGEEALAAPRQVCMTDCKTEVKITMRARVLDVTPESGGASLEGDGQAEAQPQPATAVTVNEALAEAGATVYRKCKACHQVGADAQNKVGPHLNDLMGRVAGSVEGFRYSGAMGDAGTAGLIWDEETLSAFLEKPKAYLKGTKMSFAGLKKEADRAAVIEYLKAQSM